MRQTQRKKLLISVLNEWRTRDELVELTNMPRTTIYDHLYDLMDDGLVEQSYRHIGLPGRPKTRWKNV